MTASETWFVPDPVPNSPTIDAEVVAAPDLDVVYRREYPKLVALAHGLTGRRAVAEELVQEAFVRAHQRWDEVAAMDQPSAWIRRVLVNLATSRARRLVVEARYLAGMRSSPEPPLDANTVEFWRLLRRLPTQQRVVAALYYADDLDTASIAQILDRAPGTVRAQLHAARQRLAEELALEGDGDRPDSTRPDSDQEDEDR
ncbi:MAG: sigma-70 family RNA polymerase sigma factor [Acidimicrobiia bacterium]|nr:sigma-70 family RNA polymerase sigma factor [Acidimicrobiia bacterium]